MKKMSFTFTFVLITLITAFDAFAQCDYYEDFSSDTDWTTVGSLVEIADGRLNYLNDCPDASQRRVYKSLERPMKQEDCWDMKMAFTPTSVGSYQGEPFTGHMIFSLTETNKPTRSDCADIACVGYPPSTQDALSVLYTTTNPPDGNLQFKIFSSRNGTWTLSDPIIYNELGSTIYVHLEKNCSEYVLNLFSDPDLSNPLGTGAVTMDLNEHNDFQFIQHGNSVVGYHKRELNGHIDDVCIEFDKCAIVKDIKYVGCVNDRYSIKINNTIYNERNPFGQELIFSESSCDTLVHINLEFEDCSKPNVNDDNQVCYIITPTAFTPNKDGVNDTFKPYFSKACANPNYEILIFSKRRDPIFKGNQDQNWDGTIDGKPAPSGIYVYTIRYFHEGKYLNRNGHITLIR